MFLESDSDFDPEDYEIEEYEAPEVAKSEEKLDLDIRMGRLAPPSGNSGNPGPPPGMRATGRGTGATNTGPKGVKADFEEAKRNLRNERMRERLRRERAIEQAALGPKEIVLNKPSQLEVQKKKSKDDSDSSGDEDSDFSDDDEIFRKYCMDRIKESQSNLPSYGTFERVTKVEFQNIVTSTPDPVKVVAHLYQNHLETCTRLNLSLEALAPQFPHVRFIRIRSTDLIPNYSDAGLPTILVYQDGKQLFSAVRATDVLPAKFTDLDVAKILQAKGILEIPSGFEGRQKALEEKFKQETGRELQKLDDELDELLCQDLASTDLNANSSSSLSSSSEK